MTDIEERIRAAVKPYRASDALSPTHKERGGSSRRHGTLRFLAVAAVAAVTLVVTLLPVGTPAGPDPAAAALLHRFAKIARHAGPEAAPKPGQYVYSKTQMLASRVFVSAEVKYRIVHAVPLIEERWLRLDGSGRVLTTTGDEPTFPTTADRNAYDAYLAAGGQPFEDWGGTTTDTYKPGELGWTDTSSLPMDSEQLGERSTTGGLSAGRAVTGRASRSRRTCSATLTHGLSCGRRSTRT